MQMHELYMKLTYIAVNPPYRTSIQGRYHRHRLNLGNAQQREIERTRERER